MMEKTFGSEFGPISVFENGLLTLNSVQNWVLGESTSSLVFGGVYFNLVTITSEFEIVAEKKDDDGEDLRMFIRNNFCVRKWIVASVLCPKLSTRWKHLFLGFRGCLFQPCINCFWVINSSRKRRWWWRRRAESMMWWLLLLPGCESDLLRFWISKSEF